MTTILNPDYPAAPEREDCTLDDLRRRYIDAAMPRVDIVTRMAREIVEFVKSGRLVMPRYFASDGDARRQLRSCPAAAEILFSDNRPNWWIHALGRWNDAPRGARFLELLRLFPRHIRQSQRTVMIRASRVR